MADTADVAPQTDQEPKVTVYETVTQMKPKRYRTVAKLSVGRLFKFLLCWLGMPAAVAFGAFAGSQATATVLDLWFYAGAGLFLLNASGVVPIRKYSRVEVADETH